MKKFAAIIAAAALALTGCAATAPIATQAWVLKQLASSANLAENAIVTTNSNGTVTYYSAASIPDLPQCTALSFTISSVKRGTRVVWSTPSPTFLDLIFARAYAAYPDKTSATLTLHVESGAWYERDKAGNEYPHPFNLGANGMDLTMELDLPDMPEGTHTCDIGEDCICKGAKKIETPSDLKDWDAKKSVSELGSWGKWIDKNNLPADVYTRQRGGQTSYYLQDADGIMLNLDNLEISSAWAAAIASSVAEINAYLAECRAAYERAKVCNKENPQHLPLVSSGKIDTEDGFYITMRCPRCGKTETKTHTHHFVNCGTCDAGDGCTQVCTGCNGQHVKTAATANECAKCGCTKTDGCNWHPASDMSDHAGWEPCGEDSEEDNDDGAARGSHCRCQCLTYGHRAKTDHNYQPEVGAQRYEEIKNDDDEHLKVLGKCTRCGQFKKKREAHDYPKDPTMYTWKNEDVCRWVYRCKSNGCEHDKIDETHGHSWDDKGAVWVNQSEEICRKRTQCKNCKSWKSDDSHGHERDTSNGCKCKNGCGKQYAHNYAADACGNDACTYCGTYKTEGSHSHKGWTDKDDGSQHVCACGKKTEAHTFTDWIKTGADPDVIHYARTCTVCPRLESKDKPCTHAWGEWEEIGRGGGIITMQATCSICGKTKTSTTPEPEVDNCDIEKDKHYPSASGDCGCICGKYGAKGIASSDVNFHKWEKTTNADGIQICTCKCGKFHAKRDATTYLLNARRACAAICAYCKEKSGTGIGITAAADADHTPCEVKDGHCGCLCGHLTANSTHEAKFHIQKPGSCRCLGSDGNGGSWHFPAARSDCKNICQYTVNGKQHLATSKKQEGTLTAAHPSDHTKASGRCGCECQTYTGANYSTWEGANFHNTKPYGCGCYCGHGSESQVPNFHKKAVDTDCDCQCGTKLISHVAPEAPECYCQGKCHNPQHYRYVPDGKCPAVCHGNCNEAKDAANIYKHTPEASTRCGCQCDEVSAQEFETLRYHSPRGAPECWCYCHKFHTHTAKDGCPKLCAFCDQVPDADRQGTHAPEEKDHTFQASKCECECGQCQRDHLFEQTGKNESDTYTCAKCGNNIVIYDVTYACKRCGLAGSYKEEDGHDPNCGLNHSDTGLSYCDKHDLYYSGEECPMCKEEDEKSGDNNGGDVPGGNSNNQSGNPDNIL